MTRPAPQTDRLIALFRLLAARPRDGFTVAEIARRVGVNRASLYPMIATLVEAGWLVHDPDRRVYGLGPALVGLGDAASTGFPALALVRPLAVALSEELGLSSAVFARSGQTVTLAELVWDARKGEAPMRLGQAFPLRAPFGAGFVAWAGDAMIKQWLAGSLIGRDRALDALDGIRRRGYVVELDTQLDEQIAAAVKRMVQREGDEDLLSDRAAETLIQELSQRRDSLPDQVVSGQLYRTNTIGVPIFDSRGQVTTFLVLFGFTRLMSGREIEKLGRRLCREAERVNGPARGTDRGKAK
ncbi:MAG: helix-turn-helix domain-containing protein [Acidimicrobiaceae bacterium]|nr:helix-turn-helix domain-containing protein [Acidimicrobiaceae bacterium]